MLQNSKIDSQASLLNHIELAAGLTDRQRGELLDRIRQMEIQGYDLVKADGTLELLVREALNPGASPFEVSSFEVTTRSIGPSETQSAATVTVTANGAAFACESSCHGPIDALDQALRGCLANLHPDLSRVSLSDFLVHMLEPQLGAASKAAVFIEWSGANRVWTTMGVSDNVIEASWIALAGGVRLELMRAGEQDQGLIEVADDSWAV
jgi:2-isopropylmalate synthase